MLSPEEGLHYVEVIKPRHAKGMQRLTLQDLLAGGFENPLELADPSNNRLVRRQRRKLRAHPEYYSGYVRGDEVVAYLKENDWHVEDELPFLGDEEAQLLKEAAEKSGDHSTGQWGIFGLVASDELDETERREVLIDLLTSTFTDPVTGQERTVNIVIHAKDPLRDIVIDFGFLPVGRMGIAAGAPGLLQMRYQRPASARS